MRSILCLHGLISAVFPLLPTCGHQETTRILDVSWHMPSSPRNPTEEYLAGPRIPHAHRWDLDQIAESSEGAGGPAGLGHMMPSAERFVAACGAWSGRAHRPAGERG